MIIDDKTKSVLKKNLQFDTEHLETLEKDPEKASKVLGIFQMLKKSPNDKKIKQFALSQLKEIKKTLQPTPKFKSKRLLQAREEYYSFKKQEKWKIFPRLFQPGKA